jgi:malonyl-CoA decarboxylase
MVKGLAGIPGHAPATRVKLQIPPCHVEPQGIAVQMRGSSTGRNVATTLAQRQYQFTLVMQVRAAGWIWHATVQHDGIRGLEEKARCLARGIRTHLTNMVSIVLAYTVNAMHGKSLHAADDRHADWRLGIKQKRHGKDLSGKGNKAPVCGTVIWQNGCTIQGEQQRESTMNMKSFGMRRLLQKLSSLGLETLERLSGKSSLSFHEHMRALCTTLLDLKGEASSIAIAEEILEGYRSASHDNKKLFFHFLYEELGVEHTKVDTGIARYQQERTQEAALQLAQACEAPRLELLRTLNTAPGGTMALIDMREEMQQLGVDDAALAALDKELLGLFQSWFNRGFLELRHIDWKTPAFILEKLIQYESVHEIKGWPDLRRRLERDRGCFGFFHPAIPDVPLIFVEAALTHGISTNVTSLLLQDPPQGEQVPPDTAVFYSINNCLQGLRGVSFGNFLIKQVIEQLSAEAPSIHTYVTLSPVPGFMRWLQKASQLNELLEPDARDALRALLDNQLKPEELHQHAVLQQLLPRLCAHYLVREKSRSKPLDTVARFHIGNGARLEQINWMADNSPNGLRQSAGLMVNYVYDKKQLARNHEAYEQRNEVAHSSGINKLLLQLQLD